MKAQKRNEIGVRKERRVSSASLPQGLWTFSFCAV